MTTTTAADLIRDAIIYLRLSDFRDQEDITFDIREAELRDLAVSLHLNVVRVVIENDLNGNGRARGASAYKTPLRVTSGGLVTFRTRRAEFRSVLLDLQNGSGLVLIVGDVSRLSRDTRDGADLIDACRVGRASVVAPDDDGTPRWILTDGGQPREVDALQDRINDARKYSADVAAKVRKGRRRWAGKSYQGGIRPYGYQHDPDAPEHHKTLVIVPAEAEVIRQAATSILDLGISLKAVARDLRDRQVLTVTGTAWSAKTLREVLVKPAVAGLATRDGELVRSVAIPEPILDRDVWERLRDLLTDPARRTNTSRANEPRWLVSGFAVCGVCQGPMRASGGRDRAYAYIGADCCHVRRIAARVDEHIAELVVRRLGQPDAATLLTPPPRPSIDTRKLRGELRKLGDRRRAQMRLHSSGVLTDADLAEGMRAIGEQQAAITAQLNVSDEPDPLPEFRSGRPADQVWAGLGLARRRAVVQVLIGSVVIERATRRGQGFDPETVTVTWSPEVEPAWQQPM
jgi:DNA invertase Pin-like site-specific DNA recombinase